MALCFDWGGYVPCRVLTDDSWLLGTQLTQDCSLLHAHPLYRFLDMVILYMHIPCIVFLTWSYFICTSPVLCPWHGHTLYAHPLYRFLDMVLLYMHIPCIVSLTWSYFICTSPVSFPWHGHTLHEHPLYPFLDMVILYMLHPWYLAWYYLFRVGVQ